MGMTVASDGQYRVSGRGRLSMKYMVALMCFEDKRFLTHPGVDPLAVGRALWLNVRSGSVVCHVVTRLGRFRRRYWKCCWRFVWNRVSRNGRF